MHLLFSTPEDFSRASWSRRAAAIQGVRMDSAQHMQATAQMGVASSSAAHLQSAAFGMKRTADPAFTAANGCVFCTAPAQRLLCAKVVIL